VYCDKNREVNTCELEETTELNCRTVSTDICGVYTCASGQTPNPDKTDCCDDLDGNGVCGDQGSQCDLPSNSVFRQNGNVNECVDSFINLDIVVDQRIIDINQSSQSDNYYFYGIMIFAD